MIMEVDCMEHSPQFSLNSGSYPVTNSSARYYFLFFFVIQHVNRSANLAAHLRANRACCTLNVAESWLDETPRFLLLFCGVPRFLVTSVLADRPKNAYI